MKRLIEQRYVFRSNLIPVIMISLICYFCYHLAAGQRSYIRLVSLNAQIESVERQYEIASTQRGSIEQKVVMMRPGSVNRDLLEEQARHVLGFRYMDEKILLSAGN